MTPLQGPNTVGDITQYIIFDGQSAVKIEQTTAFVRNEMNKAAGESSDSSTAGQNTPDASDEE